MRIIIILLIIKFLNIHPTKASINIINDGGIHSNVLTKESSLNQFNSDTISFFDRDNEIPQQAANLNENHNSRRKQ